MTGVDPHQTFHVLAFMSCLQQKPALYTVHREASSGVGAPVYTRHRPERTLLYQIVEEYYPAFMPHLAAQGGVLPEYVQREFEDYLGCGRFEHGFLRVRCDSCHAEHLVAFSCT